MTTQLEEELKRAKEAIKGDQNVLKEHDIATKRC